MEIPTELFLVPFYDVAPDRQSRVQTKRLLLLVFIVCITFINIHTVKERLGALFNFRICVLKFTDSSFILKIIFKGSHSKQLIHDVN